MKRYWVDGIVAAVPFVVTMLSTATMHGPVDAPTVLIAALACGVLAVRRRYPTAVFVVATVLAESYLAVSGTEIGVLVLAAPLVALYTVAEHAGWRRSTLLAAAAFLVMFALHAFVRPAWAGAQNIALISLGGFAIAAGQAIRSHRAYVKEVEERARLAERAVEQEAERRVTEERLRIARDLHDVLGHHLALITVQAGAAADVLDSDPAQSRASLRHIRQAGRAALTDLRDVVVLLRRPGDPATPTEPAGDLASLDELIAAFDRSGLRVRRHTAGGVRPVPAAVDRAVYRVIQESLTNVAKHAGVDAATLRLTYDGDRLLVVIEDDGDADPTTGRTGHGITGMRERVTAVGGRLDAGPKPPRGFRVRATIPVAGSASP